MAGILISKSMPASELKFNADNLSAKGDCIACFALPVILPDASACFVHKSHLYRKNWITAPPPGQPFHT